MLLFKILGFRMNIMFTIMSNKNSRWVPKINKVIRIGTTTVRTRPVKKCVSYFNFLLKRGQLEGLAALFS